VSTVTRQRRHKDLVALPVSKIMKHPVYTVTEYDALADALTAMVRTGRRHMVVVDAHGHCVGVVSDRAIAAAWAADPNALTTVPVHRVLDNRPSVVGTKATIGDVAREMYLDAVDAVAVIDHNGCPVGMITGGDLVALMASTWPPELDADVATPSTPAESG
jgi:CBS domain-containing protein